MLKIDWLLFMHFGSCVDSASDSNVLHRDFEIVNYSSCKVPVDCFFISNCLVSCLMMWCFNRRVPRVCSVRVSTSVCAPHPSVTNCTFFSSMVICLSTKTTSNNKYCYVENEFKSFVWIYFLVNVCACDQRRTVSIYVQL